MSAGKRNGTDASSVRHTALEAWPKSKYLPVQVHKHIHLNIYINIYRYTNISGPEEPQQVNNADFTKAYLLWQLPIL